MRRRQILLTAAALVAAPFAARAQPARDLPRVGVLDPLPRAVTAPSIASLRDGLRREGLVEGRDYRLEYRSAEGHFERLPALAAELVALPVQVIVARNTPGVRAARAATAQIPIVMADVGDPLGLGFVKNLARPEANITGLSNATLELIQKRLELMRELVPGLRRVAVLSNANDPNTPIQLDEVHKAAAQLEIEARNFDCRSVAQLEVVLDAIAAWRPQALLPLVQPLYRVLVPNMIAWTGKQRLPAVFARDGDAERGALMAYAADLSNHYLRAANYVGRILAGAKPTELPVERPVRFLFSVNLKVARAQSIAVPQRILLRADRVIE